MNYIQQEEERGILNETSMTIHKQERGAPDFQTVCGQTYHLEHGQLQMVQVRRATKEFNAETCDRCFGDDPG
jgi:hypothetical protein